MFPIIDKVATGKNIKRLMEKKNLSVKDVQEYLCLGSVQSIYHWLNGQSMPTIDNLYALSRLFQVPIDAIVRGNREPFPVEFYVEMLGPTEKRAVLYMQKLYRNDAA